MEDQQPGSNKKIMIVVGVIVLLIFIVLTAILVLSSKKPGVDGGTGTISIVPTVTGGNGGTPSSINISQGVQKTPKVVSSNDASLLIINWLDKQKSPDGRYYFSSFNTKSNSPNVDNRLGSAIVWARYKELKKNKTTDQINKINTDLDVYLNKSLVPAIQNNFWNCKLMYEMWNSKEFNESTKAKIKQLCNDSDYYPVNENTQVNNLEDYLSKVMKSQSLRTGENDTSHFNEYSSAVSDLLVLSKWDNRPDLVDLSKKYFKSAVDLYLANKIQLQSTSILLGTAAMDLYKETKNTVYLDFAKKIFDVNNSTDCNLLSSCVVSIFLAKDLSTATKEQLYNDFIKNTQDRWLSNYYDFKGENGFVSGQGAFYIKSNIINYPVRENALMAGLLSE